MNESVTTKLREVGQRMVPSVSPPLSRYGVVTVYLGAWSQEVPGD
jgi:hypothetical protein